MVYKTSKTSKSKTKSKTRKKYKGGDGGQDLSKAEDKEDFNQALAKQFKGKLKGNFSIEMYKLASRLGYTLRYNVKFMKKLQSSYTFSKGGYFIDKILNVCKNDVIKRNNYYALCILLRLFYSKDIAQTYSYFRLQQNITDNCITIYNIEKQKQLITSYEHKNNEHILEVLKDNKFYGLLQKIMNNTDPINKLKNMEQNSASYAQYSIVLSTEFNQCVTGSTNPIIKPVNSNQTPVLSNNDINKRRSDIYKKLVTQPIVHKTKKMLGLKQKSGVKPIEKQEPTPTPVQTIEPPVESSKLKFYQKTIEDMFKVVIKNKNCDLSYIILFVLNNILNKIPKLKYIHNDIPYIHNDSFCDKFYKILEAEDFKTNTFCQDEYIIDELLA
jgi:hypothetical protein